MEPWDEELFTGVMADGARARATDLPTLLRRSWGPVGVLKVRTPPCAVSARHNLNNTFILHLGPEAVVEVHEPEAGWVPHLAGVNTLTVLPAGDVHEFRTSVSIDALMVDVTPTFLSSVLGRATLPFATGVSDPLIESVLLALAAEAAAGSPHGAARAEKLCAVLLSQAMERLCPPVRAETSGALEGQRLRLVLEHVNRHLDEELRLRELAKIARLSVYHFGRAFKVSTGLTPHQYVLNARVQRAKMLLSESSLAITEIALATGFSTPSQLSATFRRLTGLTPRAFREARR